MYVQRLASTARCVSIWRVFSRPARTQKTRVDRLKGTAAKRGVRRWVPMPQLQIGGALGAGSAGALSLGAFAAGAGAIGALAIGKLAIRRGAIGSLEIGELKVDRLTVGELTVAGEQAGPPISGGPRSAA
jgi:hypothetical protein